ncbi:MAG: DUF1059 domain-containing protein [Candidatus Bathyarchaeota archaeon]|nr:DUF1059 domain-containing protein [Candidatus Bathyarchaeota archaeon]MDH5712882.1 DUF1059 domain-containing protein [Candidatus Bathyarchaeota archaeon]
MKKFVVNSTIPTGRMDPVAWLMGTRKMLKAAGAEDIKFRACYCCSSEGRVVCEFDASSKESLSEVLKKIDFPVESIMETTKVIPEEAMASFKCRDIGMACDFEATAETEDELVKKIAEHASKAHNMKTMSPEMMGKVKKAIKM